MDLSNLHTTLRAHQKMSPSILSKYATKEDLDIMRTEIADNYVSEVEDTESDKIYARNGKDRKWVELQASVEAMDIDIYFGSNDQLQMDDIDEVKSLSTHDVISKDIKTYNLEYLQEAEGKLWICVTQPIRAIKWNGYLYGDYSVQRDKVIDNTTGKMYYCYSSNEVLLANLWEFQLMF